MVTRYAVDAERGALVGAWATGAGDRAFTMAVLPSSCPPDAAMAAAAGLDRLSQVLWRTYTHPASAAGDAEEPNSEAWQRVEERTNFSSVVPGIVGVRQRAAVRRRIGCVGVCRRPQNEERNHCRDHPGQHEPLGPVSSSDTFHWPSFLTSDACTR